MLNTKQILSFNITWLRKNKGDIAISALEITTRIGCRVACRYCPQERLVHAYKDRSPDRVMAVDTFQTCLKTVPTSVEVHFLGMAEPWLNPDCTAMVHYAHNKGHRLSVSTTLAGMSLSDIEAVEHIPFDVFILHAPDNAQQMRLTVDDDYLERLERLVSGRMRHLSYKRFGDLHPAAADLLQGIPEMIWPLMNRANNLSTEDGAQTPKKTGVISCHRIRNNVLLPNGDVALCCNDYGLRHILGNLTTGAYENLFHGKEFRRVRRGMADPHAEILCRYCSEPCMKINSHRRKPMP